MWLGMGEFVVVLVEWRWLGGNVYLLVIPLVLVCLGLCPLDRVLWEFCCPRVLQ